MVKKSNEEIKKIKVSSADIVVELIKRKPYYSIKYFDMADGEYHIGFSSYDLDVVTWYLNRYMDVIGIDGWVLVQNELPKEEGVYDVTVIDGTGKSCLVTWQFLSGMYMNNSQTYVDGKHYWASNYNGEPINKYLSERVVAWRERPKCYVNKEKGRIK